MKKIFQFPVAVLFAVVTFIACNGGSDPVKEAKMENHENIDSLREKQSKDSIAMAALPSKDDADFVVNALAVSMTEVELGQLAATNARNKRVKDFGVMMVKDHGEAVLKIKALAMAKGITLPDSISNKQQREKSKLQKIKGADFDDAYMNMMVDGHKKTINDFEREADNGTGLTIRNFAGDNLATLRAHLDSALNILKAVAKPTPSVSAPPMPPM